MIVCHCNVVGSDEVRDELSNGASSVRDIVASCGVGDDCGGCLPRIEALITSTATRPVAVLAHTCEADRSSQQEPSKEARP